MRVERQQKLFVGVRVDNKLRDALEHCPSRDRAYFDGSDARYLSTMRSEEDSYLGKVVEAGTRVPAFDDVKRNILSLLTRLQVRRSDEDVKVFALSEAEPPPLPPREPVETL